MKIIQMKIGVGGLIFLASGFACSGLRFGSGKSETAPNPIYEEVRMDVSPAKAAREQHNVIPPEYVLSIGDVVEVKFFYHPEFNEVITVRPDGRITLQRIGTLYVVGMTPSSLEKLINEKYSEVIKDPEVTVFLREFATLKFYVMGHVERPGGFPWQNNVTLVRAIADAGGFKSSANYAEMILLRRDNDAIVARKIDLTLLLKGHRLTKDIPLKPNDVVYIPANRIYNLKEYVTNFYDLILPPIDVYYRAGLLNNLNRGN